MEKDGFKHFLRECKKLEGQGDSHGKLKSVVKLLHDSNRATYLFKLNFEHVIAIVKKKIFQTSMFQNWIQISSRRINHGNDKIIAMLILSNQVQFQRNTIFVVENFHLCLVRILSHY